MTQELSDQNKKIKTSNYNHNISLQIFFKTSDKNNEYLESNIKSMHPQTLAFITFNSTDISFS